MGVSEDLKQRSIWVNSILRDLEQVTKTFSSLNDEDIELHVGKKSNILEQSKEILKARTSISKSSHDVKTDAIPLKLNYAKEHKVMENQLSERLDILKEAINILNSTETNEDKLKYMTSNVDINPHLVDIGYVNVVLNYLREELVKFNKNNKLNYFTVTSFMHDYVSYKDIGITVGLKGFRNHIYMHTDVPFSAKDVKYPKNIYVTSNEHDANNMLDKINSEYINLTSEIKAYKVVIKDLEAGLLSKAINKESIKRYKLFINDSNKELARQYAFALDLQAEIEEMQESLNNFYTEIPKIEKEQDLIFDYISELFDTNVIKQKLIV